MTTPAPLMAEELMIGNYLKASRTNEIIKVDWLAIKHVEDGNIQEAGYDNSPVYEPIPLTEQWLKDFGFVELIQKTGYNTTEMVIYKPNEDTPYWKFIYGKWTVKIDYVHQLQNLYFALTATKLERGGVR